MKKNHPVTDFYDGLAGVFHLVHADWEASIQRQGAQLAAMMRERWQGKRVLDAACGVGTQALALSGQGFNITGSDISPATLVRALKEAATRGLAIEFVQADLRSLTAVHKPSFDGVLACDNSIPHLQTGAEILQSFREMYSLLRPGGGCLISVRDYASVEHRGSHVLPLGVRSTPEGRVAVFQVWDFVDPDHYDLSMFFVHDIDRAPHTQVFRTRYYAIGLAKLENLFHQAGFIGVEHLLEGFYQPVLAATRPP